MNRRTVLRNLGAGTALGIGLPLAGCIGLGTSGAAFGDVDGELVEMTDDNRFEPEAVRIPVGETVVWRTVGYAPHTVTAYENELPPEAAYFACGGFANEAAARDGASGSEGVLDRGEEYEHTFDVPGTYGYFCIPHEQVGMVGTIAIEQTIESSQGGA